MQAAPMLEAEAQAYLEEAISCYTVTVPKRNLTCKSVGA